MVDRLREAFDGDVFEFEHGASDFGKVMGCGVDQAHVHLVPLPFDLVGAASSLGGERVELCAADGDPWKRIPNGADYWLVRNTRTGTGLAVIAQEQRSQALRRIIAEQINAPEWDYRRNAAPDNAEATRAAFL